MKHEITEEEQLLGRARTAMEAKGLKPSTIQNVLGAFKQFIHLTGVKELYGKEDIQAFLASKTRDGCQGTTVHNYYRFLKIIFDRMGWPWDLKPKDLPKKNTPRQPYFNTEETLSLNKAANKVVNTGGPYGKMLQLRNRALVRLSSVTMLRRGEIRLIDVGDYRRPFILVRNPEKNSEYTERLLDSETCDAVDAYLEARKKTPCTALFITGKGKRAKRISLRGFSEVIKNIREAAGIDKPGAGWHAHRRGGITLAHKGGMSEKALSEYTGITEDIVKRYIRLDKADAIEAFEKSHPLFKKKAHMEEAEVLELLQGLSLEAQRNLLELVRNAPEAEA